MKPRRRVSSELALLLAVAVNATAIPLFIKANFGVTTASSVPHVLFLVLPKIGAIELSFGLHSFVFQLLCLLFVMSATRNANPRYALSLVVSVLFAGLADMVVAATAALPDFLAARALYYIAGLVMLSFGSSLFIRCGLPALPFDAVVRDLAAHFHWGVAKVKTVFDIVCVALTSGISLLCLGGLYSVGAGTVFAALVTGLLVNAWCRLWDRRLNFTPSLALGRRLAHERPAAAQE